MTLQNRVLATGDIVAEPVRGLFMGNRGILHGTDKTLGTARWKHKAWVTCVLKHKDWHRAVMSPGAYTELFFLDEAVALAAGHRPCALCRNADYKAFRAAAGLSGPAATMDDIMHRERAVPRRFQQRRHAAEAETLPNGAIVLADDPLLLLDDRALPISPGGYGAPRRRTSGQVEVLTPPTSLAALHEGYCPVLHTTAMA